VIGFLGDFDLAEDAAQEAFAIAAERWPRTGEPDNPGAWLTRTARNRAIDRIRRDRTLAAKTRLLGAPEAVEEEHMDEPAFPDERLELIFTCCHPALALEAQVALTLRTLGGLSTEEIARAFLVPPETMKRRLTRAKDKIRAAGIPFSAPPTTSSRTGWPRCWRSCTSSSTRATAGASTWRPRRSGSGGCWPR
jgi:RNA polymerase sigma-70 factor, ECF subfamily